MLYLSSYEYVMSCRISTEGQTFLCNTPTCCYECLIVLLLLQCYIISPNIYYAKYFIDKETELTDNILHLHLLQSSISVAHLPRFFSLALKRE